MKLNALKVVNDIMNWVNFIKRDMLISQNFMKNSIDFSIFSLILLPSLRQKLQNI